MIDQNKIDEAKEKVAQIKKPFPIINERNIRKDRTKYVIQVTMQAKRYIELHILRRELNINWEESMNILINTLKAKKTNYMSMTTFDQYMLVYAHMTQNRLTKKESLAIRSLNALPPRKDSISINRLVMIYEMNVRQNGKVELVYRFKDDPDPYLYRKTVKQTKHISKEILKNFFGENYKEEIEKQAKALQKEEDSD